MMSYGKPVIWMEPKVKPVAKQVDYPISYTHKDFILRYKYLTNSLTTNENSMDDAKKICSAVLKHGGYQIGYKICLQQSQYDYLEKLRNKTLQNVINVQKIVRGWLCRKKYKIMRNGYLRLQAVIRGRIMAVQYIKMKILIIKIQRKSREILGRNHLNYMSKTAPKKENNINHVNGNGHQEHIATNINHISGNTHQEHIVTNFDFMRKMSRIQENNNKNIRVDTDDLSEYTFRKYAAAHFTKSASFHHSKKRRKESLHHLPTPDDVLASQALWVTILRFMGDMADVTNRTSSTGSYSSSGSIMTFLSDTMSRSFQNRKEYKDLVEAQQKIASLHEFDSTKLINSTLKQKNKLFQDIEKGFVEDAFLKDNYHDWINVRKTTIMEKIHFIIGHGILRPALRDEILAMICKQLSNNNIKQSYARGWILLALCIGCFPPSETFLNYLKEFIRHAPPGFVEYCETRLNRTLQNGARTQPPSYLELIATKNKESIYVNVELFDGTSLKIEVDCASISEEVVQRIAEIINLKDTFGFSLLISVFDKAFSLGSETYHIMDAISECEQYTRANGSPEKTSPWKLCLHKEVFTPWHNPSEDPVATNLIYKQIIKRLHSGEYRCTTDTDLVNLIAMQYYIENSGKPNERVQHSKIGEYLPKYLKQNNNENTLDWEIKISKAVSNSVFAKENVPKEQAKEAVVSYAISNWPKNFSKSYEAALYSPLSNENVIIGISNTGVSVFNQRELKQLEMIYPYISLVTYENKPVSKVILKTFNRKEYTFLTPDAENIAKTIFHIIDGLQKKSIYCVAVQDYVHPEGVDYMLTLRKGDLITLRNNIKGEDLLTSGWAFGECNGKTGNFPTECVYILPTLKPVPREILDLFKNDTVVKEVDETDAGYNPSHKMKQYTLEKYASEFFRSSLKYTNRDTAKTFTHTPTEELWKYSNKLLHQPLLRKVADNKEASKKACEIFTEILKYMGDLPASKPKFTNEHTDKIFEGPLQNDLLKDEVYCQIIKQITFNKSAVSLDRGWELMYLVTGLFAPSPLLYEEFLNFLASSTHPFVEHCWQRLQKLQKVGPRKTPPHSLEVDAIKHRRMQILQAIYFPNDTVDNFEVDSLTKAWDLCRVIGSRLELLSIDGFSLFVSIADKVLSIPNDSFFYDFVNEATAWIRTNESSSQRATIQVNYQIYFIKKLWINTQPGKDPNGDKIFHYYQELSKYLKGYHKYTKQDAIKLAAIIVREKYENNLAEIKANIHREIKEIIPKDIIKAASTSEWVSDILEEYRGQNLKSGEAKIAFLNAISKWPTFGSTFFEVHQTTIDQKPKKIILAINQKGVHLIHPQTKDILDTFKFSQLSHWSCGITYFHITDGNAVANTKLLFETSEGYKMDDILTSYTTYLKEKFNIME